MGRKNAPEVTTEDIMALESAMRDNVGRKTANEVRHEARKRADAKADAAENPFFGALNAARRISTRFPADEQPEEWGELVNAMSQLDTASQSRVVFRLVVLVLREEIPVQSLFAAARAADNKLNDVGYTVAALVKALRVEGLPHTALAEYGSEDRKILEPRSNERGATWLHANLGNEVISSAAEQMQEEGKIAGARALRAYINRHEEAKLLGRARREKAEAEKVSDEESETPTAEVVSEDESS